MKVCVGLLAAILATLLYCIYSVTDSEKTITAGGHKFTQTTIKHLGKSNVMKLIHAADCPCGIR